MKFCRHDQFLHVPPGKVRYLETEEAKQKLEGLFEKFRIALEVSKEKSIECARRRWNSGARGVGAATFCLRQERFRLAARK